MTAKQVQITLIQLDNYGPWTGKLGTDREHRLQILQADLYSAIERRFAEREGLVFFNRFDEMLAVSNGITETQHQEIQHEVQDEFPVTVSMGIGVAENPFQAQLRASRLLQEKGSAQSPERTSIIACERTIDPAQSYVQIAHFDVDAITKTHTDRASAYETSMHLMTLYSELMQMFRERDALLFFVGGDNFIGVANGVKLEQIESTLATYRSRQVNLKCGIGIAHTARKAAELATTNLDLIRNSNGEKSVLATTQL
jgi:GTP cyclohydrolase IIa